MLVVKGEAGRTMYCHTAIHELFHSHVSTASSVTHWSPALTLLLPHVGERLSTGWDPVLDLLEAVPQGEELETVELAFQSVQLLCSDYMSNLPIDRLRKCIEIAALYGSQQACVALPSAAGILAADLTCTGIATFSCL